MAHSDCVRRHGLPITKKVPLTFKKCFELSISVKKPLELLRFKGFDLVGMTGFEPAAFASRTQRSTKLSHIPKI